MNDKSMHEQHAQQHILEKGLKMFGKQGEDAVLKETGQLHDRACFEPIGVKDMTEEEKGQAQMALAHLTQKQDKSVKGRTVCNGKPMREWLSREESASPTASIKGTFSTALIDAWEQQDAMSSDAPNAFTQTKLNVKCGQARVIMKTAGVSVELSMKKAPHT